MSSANSLHLSLGELRALEQQVQHVQRFGDGEQVLDDHVMSFVCLESVSLPLSHAPDRLQQIELNHRQHQKFLPC